MRIACIGSGYVGLVSGACFAEAGHEVTCLDVDAAKIASLNNGKLPIYEQDLAEVVADAVAAGRLHFKVMQPDVIANADLVLLAVGTPSGSDGSADLSYLFAAAKEVAVGLNGFTTVAVKSSVPPGTTEEVERIIRQANPSADVAVVSNPEFLREGVAIEDFRHPDRIVVGASDERGRQSMRAAYSRQTESGAPILFTSRRAAELIKYASNSFLALKVAFINEIADLAEAIGADIDEIAQGVGLDHRIGKHFLRAGPGYGGSCLPKDTLALTTLATTAGMPLRVIEATIQSNTDRRSSRMVQRVVDALGGSAGGKRVAVLGLAFKSGTDDLRESPALDIIAGLEQLGAEVVAHDPQAMDNARRHLSNARFASDPYAAAEQADALVIVTEWPEFRALDLARLAAAMRQRTIVDLRNVLSPPRARNAGFSYRGIGKSNVSRLPSRETARPGKGVNGAPKSRPTDASIARR